MIAQITSWIGFDFDNPDGLRAFVFVGILLFMFWGIRFAVLPIVAAVGYPLGAFLRRVAGFDFSFRLAVMGLFCFVPAAFVFQLFLMAFIPDTEQLSDMERIFVIFVGAPFSVFLVLVLNAACVVALKEVLGKKDAN